MKALLVLLVLLVAAAAANAAETAKPAVAPAGATVAELAKMTRRCAAVDLRADTASLSRGDRRAIGKLIVAAKIVDTLQLRQRWSGNEALWAALKKDGTPLGKARLDYFWLNKGPWSIIDGNASFMPAAYAAIAIASHNDIRPAFTSAVSPSK